MVFNGTIPGPVVAVNQGDTVEFTLRNEGKVIHSVDFHAGIGPSNVLSGNGAYGNAYTCSLNMMGFFPGLNNLVPKIVRLASPGNVVKNSQKCRANE